MKTITRTFGAFALAAIVAASGLAFAHGSGNGGGNGPSLERILDRLDRKVDLTEQQRDTLDERLAPLADRFQGMRGERRKLMQRLWENVGDPGATDQLISETQKQMGENMRLVAEAMGTVHEVLTPAQRTKVSEMLEHGRWGKRGGHGKGKHHGG